MKPLFQLCLFFCAVVLFTGCAAVTRPVTDVALGAGGAALGGELTHNNPVAVAGGAAAGVLLGEGLHYAAKTQTEKTFVSGYDQGRSDAVKQQYWLFVAQQQSANQRKSRVRLHEIHLPEQIIDGVIFQPTTQFLRIEEGEALTQ